MKEFGYTTIMQVPKLKKIVVNQGVGQAIADKKLLEFGVKELSDIAGQKAVQTTSSKDISNFKLRRNMPIGIMVTLRRERMYEFLERLICVALPRIRDFKGIGSKLDGRGNYTLGITEQIIFPEIDIDKVNKITGLDITFVTSTDSNEEAYELLKELGLPFKNIKKENN
jgi:large subunit ribosomal protein L5